MSCRKGNDHGLDVRSENKFRVVRSVEKENEFDFRVVGGKSLHCFKGEIPDSFELVFQQKPRIYSYSQFLFVFCVAKPRQRYNSFVNLRLGI